MANLASGILIFAYSKTESEGKLNWVFFPLKKYILNENFMYLKTFLV